MHKELLQRSSRHTTRGLNRYLSHEDIMFMCPDVNFRDNRFCFTVTDFSSV